MSESEPYTIFLAQPNAGSIMPCCVEALARATRGKHRVRLSVSQFGNVSHNFNMLWCEALNRREEWGLTHFAMLHSDITIEEWWLDALLEEMDRVDAEVMTTVIPIKDQRGLTTTGIRYPGQWGVKRFTMREVMQLPETFAIEDCGDTATEQLAINTGAWVCRLGRPWNDEFPGFEDRYRIVVEGGKRVCWFDSEDWLFSRWLAENGIRTFATRKVSAAHVGAQLYPNNHAWGTWETELQGPVKPLTPALAARPSPGIRIETEHPVAVDSLDHTQPLGSKQDSSKNPLFNRKLYELIPAKDVRLLDLGCAGGGLVRSILEDGGFAVGVEGSTHARENVHGEWKTIPDYLFTADITKPFQLQNGKPLRFNVITGWEILEHIPEEKLPAVMENILRHADEDAKFVGSISSNPEPHHATARPKGWWAERIAEWGYHDPGLEEHFGNCLVRGSNDPGAVSFSFCAGLG